MENAMQMFDILFQSLKAYKYTCFGRLWQRIQVVSETVLVIAVTLAKIPGKISISDFFCNLALHFTYTADTKLWKEVSKPPKSVSER